MTKSTKAVVAMLAKKPHDRKIWINLLFTPIRAYVAPKMIRKTPAMPNAGVSLGWRGSSSLSLVLEPAVEFAGGIVAVGSADTAVDEWLATVKLEVKPVVTGCEEVVFELPSVVAASDAGRLLCEAETLVGELGESVVKVGNAPFVGSCRLCRSELSRPAVTTGNDQLNSVSMMMCKDRMLNLTL